MKKKIFSILLSLAMVVTMMPAMALTAFASQEYLVYVNDKPIIDNQESDVFGNETVKFTPSEGSANARLTLNNATLTKINYVGNETLDIEVSGNCTITPSADGTFGILTWRASGDAASNTDASLRIYGNGTLTIDLTSADASERKNGIFVNKDLTIEDVTLKVNIGDTATNNHGIHAENDIIIDGAKVSSTVGSSEKNTTKPICAYHDVIIKDGAEVTANAGTSSADGSYAIFARNEVNIGENETKVNATSGKGVNSCGILAEKAVTITGGKIIAKAGAGNWKAAIAATTDGSTFSKLTVGEVKNVASITGASGITKGEGEISGGHIIQSGEAPVVIAFKNLNSWSDLQNAINDASSGEVLVLGGDITANSADSALNISTDKNIILDLNGHVLNRNLVSADGTPTNKEHGSVIEISGGALTIKDSASSTTHAGYVDKNGLWHLGTAPTGVTSTAKTIYGGIITGGTGQKQSSPTAYYGAGIVVKGELIQNGGTICGNALPATGGGVWIKTGSFVMNKGAISYNNSDGVGGGVTVEEDATFTMNSKDCIISNNKSLHNAGGGVFAIGNFTMNCGKIDSNSAEECGGGVYAEGVSASGDGANFTKHFIMKDGEITNNTSKHIGAGVRLDSYNMDMIMTGGKITGNTVTLDGGKTKGEASGEAGGGGIWAVRGLTVGGTAIVSGNKQVDAKGITTISNVLLPIKAKAGKVFDKDIKIRIDSNTPLKETAVIGISTDKAPTSSEAVAITASCDSSNYGEFFSPDATGLGVRYNKLSKVYELVNGKCSIDDKFYSTLQAAVNAVTKDKTIVLYDNNTENVSVAKEVTFKVDQNGHTFDARNITAANGFKLSYKVNSSTVTEFTVEKAGIDYDPTAGGSGGIQKEDGKTTLTMTYGDSYKIPAKSQAGGVLSFKSNNVSVVTVASDGTVKAVAVGTTTITISDTKGTGDTITVTVNPKALTAAMVADIPSQDYTGSEIKPTVTVKDGTTVLVEGTTTLKKDYLVTYKNNKEIGKATVTITGTGNYTGTNTKTFSILKPLDKIEVPNSTTGQPNPVLKDGTYTLVKGTDYTVSYKDNDKIGYATCIIKGMGKYSEYYKEVQFKVLPKKSAVKKYTAGKKKATITWKKVTGVDGYWIRVATNKKFTKGLKKIKVAKGTATKKVVKLKAGKRYYVKVRAYKKVSNPKTGLYENFYANWSTVKRTKTIKR